ncbi:MAG: helix-turn-helix transcriptional regulator, partial [Oscillospiraceae bacterium]|nr:helix-turn-helix transcriptional regulator [Oscillospiraceae bacterium]
FLLKPSKMDEIREALACMTARLQRDHTEQSVVQGDAEERENAGSFLVNRALDYLEEHYAEKLTLQEVADACYVSQWHLSKLLNRYTKKNFYDLLNTRRIRAAKELLADPSLRIGDIGEMIGYADPAHFARVFRKIAGMSANEYRNSL